MKKKNPVIVYRPHGELGDEIDRLALWNSFEHPDQWEETIRHAHEESKTDDALACLLSAIHLQEDRAEAFNDFTNSDKFAAIKNLIVRFGVGPDSSVCDVGCGPGYLAYALHNKAGFKHVTAMDPNNQWHTGTGYLQSLEVPGINIIDNFDEWRTINGRFDAVVSQGTIHHWSHIALGAIDVRRTLKPGKFWFAFSEYFATRPNEFSAAIRCHPTASRYGSYEWAYPPSVYVDLIQSVGFNLVSVIPYFYDNNRLVGSMRPVPEDVDIAAINEGVDCGLVTAGGTVEQFWDEVDLYRRQDHGHRIYTEPQLLIFQRVAV